MYSKEYIKEHLYNIPLNELVHIFSKISIDEVNEIMLNESEEFKNKIEICANEEAQKVREEAQKVREENELKKKYLNYVTKLNDDTVNKLNLAKTVNRRLENEINMYQNINNNLCGAV